VPAGQEPRQCLLLDGLDLLAECGQRGAAQAAQHVGVAPLALGAARSQLAAHELLVALERDEDRRYLAPEALVRLLGGERPPSLREAQHELTQRVGTAFEVCVG